MKQLPGVFPYIAALLFFLGPSIVFASGPKIQLDEEVFNFGSVKQGTKVLHEFTFKNLGDADLVITDVKTSCGCTAAVTSARTIAPGGEGTLKVSFNSSGRSGSQNKSITLVSNDPENPRLMVRLSGKVDRGDQPQIRIEPKDLDIGVIDPGGSKSSEVTITNTGKVDLVLESFVGRNHVSVRNGDEEKTITIKPQESVKIEVVAAPEKTSGIYQGYLQIRNNSSQRLVTVPVFGYVSNKYMLKPGYEEDE
jgi:hypothetical protein